MSPLLAEATSTFRRFARRRAVGVVVLLDVAAVAYGALVATPATPWSGLAAAAALGGLTTVVLASGLVADDRAAGRLALAATHPIHLGELVAGRWLAVAALSTAVATAGGAALALASGGSVARGPLALALGAAACHLAALGALALFLSCVAGATSQVLVLLAVLVAGIVPPALAAEALPWPWLRPAVPALWTIVPTPWALDRVQHWALGDEGAVPLLLAALLLQPPLFLAAGGRLLARAELGARPD